MQKRINEVDVLRGFAVVLMVIFHSFVDLYDFFGVGISYHEGIIYLIGRAAAFIFIFVSGVSAELSGNNLKNAARTFLAGLAVSIATYFFDSETFVIFGILQFLSFCMLSSHFSKKYPPWIFIVFVSVSVIIGLLITDLTAPFWWLLPFGVYPASFQSVDYYPIFPYISIFFAGNFFGRITYVRKREPLLKDFDFSPLSFLGRHSLAIYLVHQPVIYGVFYLLFMII